MQQRTAPPAFLLFPTSIDSECLIRELPTRSKGWLTLVLNNLVLDNLWLEIIRQVFRES